MPKPQGNPKGYDPHTPIPPAVRRQAEEAERLQQAYISGDQPPQEGGETPPSPPPQPKPGDPPPLPSNAEPVPPPPAKEEPSPLPSPPQPRAEGEQPLEEGDYKHRYETTLGRLRKANDDISRLSQDVTDLRHVLSTMQTGAPTAADPQLKFEAPQILSPEEREEWKDILPVIEKRANELIAPLKAELEHKLGQVDGRLRSVNQGAQQNARQRMLDALDNHPTVKDWRIINEEPEFIEWLKYPDELSGEKRHDMLRQAFDANDARRVAAFFDKFTKATGAPAPLPSASQPGSPPSEAPGLEQFAAPGKPRTAASRPGAPAEQEIIKQSDISRFYADSAAGRFNTPELKAKAAAYEAQIFAATREGRVQPG